jgi:hypothetical protein
MQRLKDAGLNPNLIYGSSPAGASGSAGSISPSKAAPYSIQNPVPSAAQTALLGPQIANQKAEALLKLSQAATNKSTKDAIDAKLPIEVENLSATGNKLREDALQAKLNTIKLNKTTKDDIRISAQNVIKATSESARLKAESDFKKKLLKNNINPNAGIGSSLIQIVTGGIIDIVEMLFPKGGN